MALHNATMHKSVWVVIGMIACNNEDCHWQMARVSKRVILLPVILRFTKLKHNAAVALHERKMNTSLAICRCKLTIATQRWNF